MGIPAWLKFEESRVPQEVLEIYTKATSGFETSYQGNRAVRDEGYQGSFVFGTHPRPLAIRI